MNVSESSSSGSELSDEDVLGAVDIPFEYQGSPYTLADKKAFQIMEVESQKIDELMAKFTKGFDPGAFGGVIMAYIPKLTEGLFPGSYAHLLILLFETFDVIQHIQLGLEALMGSQHQISPTHQPSATNITDEAFFAKEIGMLRKLLAPIREGTRNSIFWVGTRRVHTPRISEQLEAAIRVIETFKDDLCAALKPDHECKTIYSTLPVSVERTAMYSMKQLRLDTCRATLQWDNFNGSELELTSFFCFYKEHIMKTEPAKARESGWLPPKSPGTPRLSAEEASEGDLASWASHGVENELIDLLLKIALWLSLARGLPAVHLFCDVVRLFVMDQPSKPTTNEYRRFLWHSIRLRAATGAALLSPSPVVPDNKNFPTRNVDYFQDIWRTGHQLSQGLFDNTSLLAKHNVPNFKLAKPPAGRRSGHGDMQVATQAAVPENLPAHENLPDIPTTPDEEHREEESPDDCGFALSPPEQSPVFRTRTV